jgi:putative ABC transport system substrate-binding protein
MRKAGVLSILLVVVLLAVPVTVGAQQPTKVPLIGYLSTTGDPGDPGNQVEAFRQGLRNFGHIEGKNVLVEYRYVEGNVDRIPSLVAELVQLKVDVFVTAVFLAIRLAKQATKTIPIVMVTAQDPVAAGFIDSLARPGGKFYGDHQTHPRVERKTAGIAQGDSAEDVAHRCSLGCERVRAGCWF